MLFSLNFNFKQNYNFSESHDLLRECKVCGAITQVFGINWDWLKLLTSGTAVVNNNKNLLLLVCICVQ